MICSLTIKGPHKYLHLGGIRRCRLGDEHHSFFMISVGQVRTDGGEVDSSSPILLKWMPHCLSSSCLEINTLASDK